MDTEGEALEAYENDIRGFAVYKIDTDVLDSRPITTYSKRLEEHGFQRDGSGSMPLWRRYTAEPDIRFMICHYNPNIDMHDTVTLSAPMDTDIYDTLPDDVFDDIHKHAVGIYHDEKFSTNLRAPEYKWELAEM